MEWRWKAKRFTVKILSHLKWNNKHGANMNSRSESEIWRNNLMRSDDVVFHFNCLLNSKYSRFVFTMQSFCLSVCLLCRWIWIWTCKRYGFHDFCSTLFFSVLNFIKILVFAFSAPHLLSLASLAFKFTFLCDSPVFTFSFPFFFSTDAKPGVDCRCWLFIYYVRFAAFYLFDVNSAILSVVRVKWNNLCAIFIPFIVLLIAHQNRECVFVCENFSMFCCVPFMHKMHMHKATHFHWNALIWQTGLL